jgi:sugar phosphate isomerase/epimerase
MTLPVLGGAFVTFEALESHRDWLLAAPRDVELQMFIWPQMLDDDIAPHVARARALLDGVTGRIGLHGPFLGFKIDCVDPAIAAIAQARLLKGLEICAAVGATQMVVHSPVSTWDDSNHAADPAHGRNQIDRTLYLMGPVVQRAEQTGVELVIENVEDKDPQARLAIAAAFGSEAVQLSLDTGHAHYAHVMTHAPAVDVYVRAAGKMLRHVHLQDSDGYADRHWHPGEGNLPWRAIFAALRSLPAMPRLIIEVKDQKNVRKGAAHLAALDLAL